MPTSISTWVDEIRSGNLRALSRAITAVENRTPESLPLLQSLFAYSGRARIVGITGAPGAGKSTLVDALAAQFRARRQTAGIIAIDPTSPFTGGAILGDRIRMASHSMDEGIFIRSMATRGCTGRPFEHRRRCRHRARRQRTRPGAHRNRRRRTG